MASPAKKYTSSQIKPLPAFFLVLVIIASGCGGASNRLSGISKPLYVKPTVGVLPFTNRVPGQGAPPLGADLAEQLTEKLIQTKRYTVLEPQQTLAVLTRMAGHNRRSSRTEIPVNTLPRQMRYVIKGKITDYGYLELTDWRDRVATMQMFNKGSAMVGATLSIVDTQTGHTIAIKTVVGKVNCDRDKLQQAQEQDQMGFASNSFYYTIMGKATKKFLKNAVREIRGLIENPPFQPKIASVVNDQVIINGGRERGIKLHGRYLVRPPSELILDPDSSVQLGYVSGKQIGILEVTQVMRNYAIAAVIETTGELKPDQTLFLLGAEANTRLINPTVQSHY